MTFKIEISQFYDYSGPEQWKLNKNKNQTFCHGTYSNLAPFK